MSAHQSCQWCAQRLAVWHCAHCRWDRAFLCDACRSQHEDLDHRLEVYQQQQDATTATAVTSTTVFPSDGDAATPKPKDDANVSEITYREKGNVSPVEGPGVIPSPPRARRRTDASAALTAADAADADDRLRNDAVAVPFDIGDEDTVPVPVEHLSNAMWKFGDPLLVHYVTWNLANSDPPTDGSLGTLIKQAAHILAVGTQENGPYVGPSSAQKNWVDLVTKQLNTPSNSGVASADNKPARPTRKTAQASTYEWILVSQIGMMATHLVVYARSDVYQHIGGIHTSLSKTGLGGGAIGNKGGVAVAFAVARRVVNPVTNVGSSTDQFVSLDEKSKVEATPQQTPSRSHPNALQDSPRPAPVSGNSYDVPLSDRSFVTFLFVCAHLAAHQNAVEQRNRDYATIVSELEVGVKGPFPGMARRRKAAVKSQTAAPADDPKPASRDCTEEFDVTLFGGDLNYRINGAKFAIEQIVARHRGNRAVLTMNDQLTIERQRGFTLEGFDEGRLFFRPTYKFSKDKTTGLYTDTYDIGKKQRLAAYCDRVLYRRHPDYTQPVELLHYSDACNVTMTSDHRPVSAIVSVGTTAAHLRGSGVPDADFDAAMVERPAGCCARGGCLVM